jgi:hypothetical protein
VPSIQSPLDQSLYDLTMAHLSKLAEYVPGPVKKAGAGKHALIRNYHADPLFSIWGLDSPEYVSATLSGGTITSIHRKLGDIYQDAVKMIFVVALAQKPADVIYSAIVTSGTKDENRSADAYLQFDRLKNPARRRITAWCGTELKKLTANPQVKVIGVGMEIRHCYQTGDSKRTQADEAMARHLLVSGILPVMPLFCNQSNPGIVARYRSVWIVKQGMESYDVIKAFTGYDYYDFLKRNREDFRAPIIAMLRRLSA